MSADVFAFDVAREWDVGLGSMNQIRADLMASLDPYVKEAVSFAGDLTPYGSWEDFGHGTISATPSLRNSRRPILTSY